MPKPRSLAFVGDELRALALYTITTASQGSVGTAGVPGGAGAGFDAVRAF